MATTQLHASHDAVVKRLKRAHGHLHDVIAMLADERDCLDVAQQLHAVERAIAAAKRQLIHDHIDHCLEHALEGSARSSRQAVAGFKAVTKYL